jgi:hypothetical protein
MIWSACALIVVAAVRRMHPHKKFHRKNLSLIIFVALILTPIALASTSSTQTKTVQLTTTQEYTNYVHTYINSTQGNYTYVEKPMFPVLINDSQIPIGENWTIVCPLTAGHSYHVYCFGQWIDTSSQAQTDYNIFVYDPKGNLVSLHLESAGLPPHLGSTLNDVFFTPTESGKYSFVIDNSAFGSEGSQEATFMIIENLQTDTWYNTFIQGTNGNDLAQFDTCWAYEFATNASAIEVCVKVPQTLAIYETRLYLMSDSSSSSLNSYPLPWEAGLYGNLTGSVGGYNFESDGYRGVAYTSDEQMGQTLFLNYTSKSSGTNLYHLVFIGDVGAGNVSFIIKTTFLKENLTPLTVPSRVYPSSPAQIAYTLNNTDLDSAQLSYTVDNWTSTNNLNMEVNNQTCNAQIPGQAAGSLVQYSIQARDAQMNSVVAAGEYTVRENASLGIALVKEKIVLGKNVTVSGTLTPCFNGSVVYVQFATANAVKNVNCTVSADGKFIVSWKPTAAGQWAVTASSRETQLAFAGYSQELTLTVMPPPLYQKYSMFIIIGFVALMAVGGVAYFLSSRRG